MEGWKCITNDPYVLSIVAKGYRLRFTSPSTPNPLGDQIPPGARGNSRHAGTNHPHASEERNNRGASELPRILLKRIPGTQSFRRMASSYRFKKSERPHSCTSFSYVHYKLSSEFRSKRRLRVQNRSAGCILSHTNPSQQQEVPQVRLFLTSGIPIRTFQAEFTIFTDASTKGWGAHKGDSQISGTWTCRDRKLYISCLELKAVVSALQHWAPLLQGHQVMIVTDNSTVVSYINKQGGTRSPTLLLLTVDLLLWLEALVRTL